MKDELVLIDTNILVYAFDIFDKNKHEKSKNILGKCWNGEEKFALSLQNLSEFYVITTKKINIPLSKNIGSDIVNKFLEFKGWIKLVPKESTITQAMDLAEKYDVSYWDALIASAMLERGIKKIYTENIKDFSKIKELKVINPF